MIKGFEAKAVENPNEDYKSDTMLNQYVAQQEGIKEMIKLEEEENN